MNFIENLVENRENCGRRSGRGKIMVLAEMPVLCGLLCPMGQRGKNQIEGAGLVMVKGDIDW